MTNGEENSFSWRLDCALYVQVTQDSFCFDVLCLISYLAQTEHPINVCCGLNNLQAAFYF